MTVDPWALVGFAVVVLAHTGALFYWGGSIRQMLRDHERRLTNVEEWRERHDDHKMKAFMKDRSTT